MTMTDANPDKLNYIYNSQLDAFTLYHISQESSHDAVGAGLPALGHAISGAAGTAVSKMITYPLDIVITRLQVQKQLQRDSEHPQYNGILDEIEKMYEREGGLPAFYSGVVPETIKGIADSFLFFLAYSYVRQKRLDVRGNGKNLPVLEEIGVGAIAGAISKFFTTPIQQLVTRRQTAAMSPNDPSSQVSDETLADIAREIYKEKGLQGFWSGYSASLVLTLNPSITMLLHKMFLRLLIPRTSQSDPGARVTFLLAAMSKAVASTVTYPFSLAKTRVQVSLHKPMASIGEKFKSDKPTSTPKWIVARARERTVFSTILYIAQTEGIWALYQGLGAEVLKGFFSHGITMLMKDRIHSAIITLYYSISQQLSKYSGLGEVVQDASQGVQSTFEQGKNRANELYKKGAEVANNTTERVKEVTYQATEGAQSTIEKGKEQASELYSKGGEVVGLASSSMQGAMESGSQKVQRVAEAGRDTAQNVSQQAGEMLQKGQETAASASQQVKDTVLQAEVRDVDGPDGDVK